MKRWWAVIGMLMFAAACSISPPRAVSFDSKRGSPSDMATQSSQENLRAWQKDILEKLSCPVSVEFLETPVSEAVQYLARLGNINLLLDPVAAERLGNATVTLKQDNASLLSAIAVLESANGLEHTMALHACVISVPERIAELKTMKDEIPVAGYELDNAIVMAFRKAFLAHRVSFEFVETPVSEAVQFTRALPCPPTCFDRPPVPDRRHFGEKVDALSPQPAEFLFKPPLYRRFEFLQHLRRFFVHRQETVFVRHGVFHIRRPHVSCYRPDESLHDHVLQKVPLST